MKECTSKFVYGNLNKHKNSVVRLLFVTSISLSAKIHLILVKLFACVCVILCIDEPVGLKILLINWAVNGRPITTLTIKN